MARAAAALPASTASSRLPSVRGPVLFLVPAATLYGVFVLWPIAAVVRTSLLVGGRLSLVHYTTLLSDPSFQNSLVNTVRWEAAAVVIPTVVALGVALMAARTRAVLPLVVLLFPALLPPTVIAAVWVLLYSPASGPLTVLGMPSPDWLGDPHLAPGALFGAWAWSAVGIGTLLFWIALRRIGREWGEIAALEGAGVLWRFRHVTLPALRRPLILVIAVNAALAAQVFDLIFTTTGGGPGNATMLLSLEVYGRAFGGRPGQGAAAAVIQLALGVVLAGLAVVGWRGESLEGEPGPSSRRGRTASGVLLAIAAVMVMPFAWLVPVALAPSRIAIVGGLNLQHPTLANVSGAWQSGMAGAFGESLLLAALVVGGTVVLSYPAAFALTERLPRSVVMVAAALLLVGLFQGTSALLVPLFSLLIDLHLLDSVWGITLPEIGEALPFAIFILWGFLSQLPPEIGEAAAVDGASYLTRMLAVALPLTRPALLAAVVWAFVTSWNAYVLPLVVSQDSSIQTVPTLLAGLIGVTDTQYGLLAAGSLMAIVPPFLAYLALRATVAGSIRGILR